MKKIFAVALLSLALAACDSGSTDNNSNANAGTNSNSKPAPTIEQASPAPVVPTPETSPSATSGLKAGDKVRVPINGASVAADAFSACRTRNMVRTFCCAAASWQNNRAGKIARINKDFIA